MKNVIGSLISVILIFFMLCITPIFYLSTIEYAKSSMQALSATRNLVDEVIDTGTLSDTTLADYNLLMASMSDYYSVKIIHKAKVVSPDPLRPGYTYTTYVVVDDLKTFTTGDEIMVIVRPLGENMFQSLSSTFLNMRTSREGFTLVGKVR